jgi:hypothetical protein
VHHPPNANAAGVTLADALVRVHYGCWPKDASIALVLRDTRHLVNPQRELQMWDICNEPNWLIIVVLLLFSVIAPLVIVRVRARASRKHLIKEFRNVLWERYAREKKLNDEDIADRLISYLDRLVDRHINKARGILPFNSILLAVFTFEANRFASARPYLLSPITGLLVSSALCLSMFLVYWQRDVYTSWSSEVDFSVQKVIKTSIKIEWAAWISLFCMVIGAVVIAIVEGDLSRYFCANL